MSSNSDTVDWFTARISEHGQTADDGVCLCGVIVGDWSNLPVHVAGSLVSAGAAVEAPREWYEGAEAVTAFMADLLPGDEVAVESIYPDPYGATYSAHGPWDAIELNGAPLANFIGMFRIALLRQAMWDRAETYAVRGEDDILWIREADDPDALWVAVGETLPPRTTSEMIQTGDTFELVAVRVSTGGAVPA